MIMLAGEGASQRRRQIVAVRVRARLLPVRMGDEILFRSGRALAPRVGTKTEVGLRLFRRRAMAVEDALVALRIFVVLWVLHQAGELAQRVAQGGAPRLLIAQAPLELLDLDRRASFCRFSHDPSRFSTRTLWRTTAAPPIPNAWGIARVQRISSGAFTPRSANPDASTTVNVTTKARRALVKS